MKKLLTRIIKPWTMAVANIAIIIAVELSDGGKFFVETGLIHGVAILFIFLAIGVLFLPYQLYDQYAKKFLWGEILAMLIFASSHITEFLSYKIFDIHEDAVFANVANFYIISILVMLVGSEMFFKAYHRGRTKLFLWLYGLSAAIFAFLVVFNVLNDDIISLEKMGAYLSFYIISIIGFGFLGMTVAAKFRVVSIVAPFVRYFRISLFFIIMATLINVFYVILEETLGVPDYQIINFAHFSFYAALSGMIVSLSKLSSDLSHLGGMYSAVREYENNHNNTAKP